MQSGVAWEQPRTGHLITNALLALIVDVIMMIFILSTVDTLVSRHDAGSDVQSVVVHSCIIFLCCLDGEEMIHTEIQI